MTRGDRKWVYGMGYLAGRHGAPEPGGYLPVVWWAGWLAGCLVAGLPAGAH